MCQDLIKVRTKVRTRTRVSMGVTPIRPRIRAKVGEIIRIIRTMDEGTIRITCHLLKRTNRQQKKKVDLEEALAQMLTSHTTFKNETKANMQNQLTQLNNQALQLRNLKAQMGQMANLLTER